MKKSVSLLLAVVFMLLCSCSVQTEFDIKNFCDRFNSLAKDELLSPENFMSDGEGKLFAFVETCNSKMLVSVDVNANQSVETIGVSIFKDTTDQDDFARLFELVSCAVDAYLYPDENPADEILTNLGVSSGENPFENGFSKYEYKKYVCCRFSDGFSLSVKIDKQPSDSVK